MSLKLTWRMLLLLFIGAAASDLPVEEQYQRFLHEYRDGKELPPPSTGARFDVFRENLRLIDERNRRGNELHGVNQV